MNPWLAVFLLVLVPFTASYFARVFLKYMFVRDVRREETKPDWNEVKAKIEERVFGTGR